MTNNVNNKYYDEYGRRHNKYARRRNRRVRKQRGIFFAVFLILVAIGVTWVIVNSDGANPAKTTPPAIEYRLTGSEPIDTLPRYLDLTRIGRYFAYASAHPDVPMDDVYWMVDCNLDEAPYAFKEEIPDPNSILQLVSKYFYLPSAYEPADLIEVGDVTMRREAGEAILKLTEDAKAQGLDIYAGSGYRSYKNQASLYNKYKRAEGKAAADDASARPGFSEHQTGLTADLNTSSGVIGETAEGKWLAENCWQYGCIVRYTKQNADITHYKPEPWHIRYIGLEAAKTMHDEGITSFEEYWVKYVLYPPNATGISDTFGTSNTTNTADASPEALDLAA